MNLETDKTGIAVLVSIVAGICLYAPAAGYFIIGKTKKGLLYWAMGWAMAGLGAAATFVAIAGLGQYGTGLVCPLFLGMFVVGFDLAVVYDVYLESKGARPILPGL